MLEVRDVNFKREDKQILKNINMVIPNGKLAAITGPNGSGKSTLAKIIMGIEKPDSGQVILNEVDITNKSIDERARLGVGFAFQQVVKFKGITVYDLIRMSSGKEVTKVEACNILSMVGLCAKEYIDREVNNSLSGGELKRIEIATVAVRDNKLIIFDEPEAGIDLWSFTNLIKVFEKLRERNSESITLIISHQERILNIADTIILLNNGEIEKVGNRESIKNVITDSGMCCKLTGGADNE